MRRCRRRRQQGPTGRRGDGEKAWWPCGPPIWTPSQQGGGCGTGRPYGTRGANPGPGRAAGSGRARFDDAGLDDHLMMGKGLPVVIVSHFGRTVRPLRLLWTAAAQRHAGVPAGRNRPARRGERLAFSKVSPNRWVISLSTWGPPAIHRCAWRRRVCGSASSKPLGNQYERISSGVVLTGSSLALSRTVVAPTRPVAQSHLA